MTIFGTEQPVSLSQALYRNRSELTQLKLKTAQSLNDIDQPTCILSNFR